MKRLLSLKEDPVIERVYSMSRGLGVKTFLVGGMLRDIFLSLPIGQDYDLVLIPVSLSSKGYMAEMAERIARGFHGSFFPLDIENSVYRIVIKDHLPLFSSPGSRETKVFIDLSPIRGGGIEKDLRLRDFTMNAIALDLKRLFTGDEIDVIDPFCGREDLQKGLVRSCSEGAFTKDPVRLLRGVRFSAVYGLTIEDKTRGYIKRYACMLKDASGERIRDELFSILDVKMACPYVEDLSLMGLLEEVLPYPDGCRDSLVSKTFPTLREGEAILSSISDIAPSFTSEIADYLQETIGGVSRASLLKLAAMIHDIADCLSDRGAIIERMAAEVGKRLKLSKKAGHLLKNTTKGFPIAFKLLTTARLTDLDMYLFFRQIGRDGISPLLFALSSIRSGDTARRYKEAASRMERIFTYLFKVFSELSSSPLLTGAEIMELFDIGEGKVIGDIVKMIEEARARGIIKDKEGAVRWFRFAHRKVLCQEIQW